MMNKDYELFGCFAPFRSPILVSMAAIAEVERLCAEAPCMVVSADGSVFWKCVHPNAESLNDGSFPHFMIQVVESTICTAFWQRQCCKWFKRPSDIVQRLPAYTWWRTRWESCDMIIYQNKSQMQAFWVILSTEMWDKWIKLTQSSQISQTQMHCFDHFLETQHLRTLTMTMSTPIMRWWLALQKAGRLKIRKVLLHPTWSKLGGWISPCWWFAVLNEDSLGW